MFKRNLRGLLGFGPITTIEADTTQPLGVSVTSPTEGELLTVTVTTIEGKRVALRLRPFHWDSLASVLQQHASVRRVRLRHDQERSQKVAGEGKPRALLTPLERLREQFGYWCAKNALPSIPAEELLDRKGLTELQTAYVRDYLLREAMELDAARGGA